MKEQLNGALGRVWAQFRQFTPGQKAVSIAALLALLIGGYVFTTWKSTPAYAPLYTNLAASDASAIVDKLNSAGVPYQLAQAGTEIMVPQDKVYATRLTISAAGLPSSSQTGYSLLDKEGVTTSEFKQQIDYQRALEGELDKTIQSMDGVQSANVHLAIPQQNVFNDGTQKTSASVMVATAPGVQLTSGQVQSLVYLVSSSVPNLSSNDVTIADANGQLLAAPGQDFSAAVGADTRSQATQSYDQQQQQKIEQLLAPVLGAGHYAVNVNAQLNFDQTSTTDKSYIVDKNAPPLSSTTSSETYTGSGAGAAGGVLGSAQGTTVNGTGGGGPSKYTKSSTTQDNALGTHTVNSQIAPGGLQQASVSVLVDSSVKGVSLAKITQLVRSAADVANAPKTSVSVQAMPFSTTAAKQAAAQDAQAAAAAAAAASSQRMQSLIKQGVLGAIVLAVLLGTWLASRRRRKRAAQPVYDDGADELTAALFPPLPEPAPMPTAVPAMPSAAVLEAQEAATRRRALVALADQQPKDVAAVLSSWLGGKSGDLENANARSSW